jgi:hypothetical protein
MSDFWGTAPDEVVWQGNIARPMRGLITDQETNGRFHPGSFQVALARGGLCISTGQDPATQWRPRENIASRRPKKLRVSSLNVASDFLEDERDPNVCHSIVKYTGKDRIIDVLRMLPQDIGDMIGKYILHHTLLGEKGYNVITKKVCQWMRGSTSWEDWNGHHIGLPRSLALPRSLHFRGMLGGGYHCELAPDTPPEGVITRSQKQEPVMSIRITTYGRKRPLILWVPVFWVEKWAQGRNHAVQFINKTRWCEEINVNWFDVFSQCCPTLGQWCYLLVCRPRDRALNYGDGEQGWTTKAIYEDREWFGCRAFWHYGEKQVELWEEMNKGWEYRGENGKARDYYWMAYQGGDEEVYDGYDDNLGYTHLGFPSTMNGWRSMKFCENTFFYRRNRY